MTSRSLQPGTALEHFHGPDEMQRLVIGQQDTYVPFETTDLRVFMHLGKK
jgi:hypothetical protein